MCNDYSCNIILLLRGMSRISGCHDWLQQWQSVFISLPSVLAHAKRSESVSSLEKTCVSLCMCPQNISLHSPLNTVQAELYHTVCLCVIKCVKGVKGICMVSLIH